jgi:tetratricopeptide (TPR) repeat protein
VGSLDASAGDQDTVEQAMDLESADTVVSAGATADLTRRLGPDPKPADEIGRYQLRRILGKGGMGTVFSAHDPELDRTVALKLLRRANTRDEKSEARLLREARALAALSHPNVVEIFDVGSDLAGLYIAMEQIDGPDVRVWLGEQPRTWQEIVTVFRQAGRGLEAAHAVGIVHRDFKPSNVLLPRDGEAKVADFGLARGMGGTSRISTDPSRSASLSSPEVVSDALAEDVTHRDEVVGTPVYMAPEQFRHGQVEAAADQYSFCASLYHCLFGRHPYDAEGFMGIRNAVLGGLVVPPPRDTDIPGWLTAVVMRGLARDPDDRYPSMHELLVGLEGPRRRGWWALGAVAAMGTAAVAFAAFERPLEPCDADAAWAQTWSDRSAGDVAAGIASVGRAYADDVASRVDGVLEQYGSRWKKAYAQGCQAGAASEASDVSMACLRRQRDQIDTVLDKLEEGHAPVVRRASQILGSLPDPGSCLEPEQTSVAPKEAELQDVLAHARFDLVLAENRQSRDRANNVVEQARQAGLQRLEADGLLVRGRAEETLGHLDEAERDYEQSFWLAQRLEATGTAVRTAAALMTLLGNRGRLDDAEGWARHVESLLPRLPDADEERGDYYDRRAGLYGRAGDFEAAVDTRRRALEILTKAEGPDDPDVATVLANLGRDLRAAQRYAEAEQALDRAHDILSEQLGPRHPEVGRARVGLGVLASVQRQYPQAREHFEHAVELYEDGYGPNAPQLVGVLTNLGNVYNALDLQTQSLAAHQRALDILEEIHGPDDLQLSAPLHNAAYALDALGRRSEALAYHRRALAIESSVLGADHVEVAISKVILGSVVAKEEDYAQAQRLADEALPVLVDKLGQDHFIVGIGRSTRARALAGLGDADGAIAGYEEALAALGGPEVDPEDRARAELALAKLIWDDPEQRGRAVELSDKALEDFEQADAPDADEVQSARAWVDRVMERSVQRRRR